MTDTKGDTASPKKTMQQLLEEKAKRVPNHRSVKTKAKLHKGSNKAPRPTT